MTARSAALYCFPESIDLTYSRHRRGYGRGGLTGYGGLAQLARAPALQAGGQRFESVILHKLKEHIDILEAVKEEIL